MVFTLNFFFFIGKAELQWERQKSKLSSSTGSYFQWLSCSSWASVKPKVKSKIMVDWLGSETTYLLWNSAGPGVHSYSWKTLCTDWYLVAHTMARHLLWETMVHEINVTLSSSGGIWHINCTRKRNSRSLMSDNYFVSEICLLESWVSFDQQSPRLLKAMAMVLCGCRTTKDKLVRDVHLMGRSYKHLYNGGGRQKGKLNSTHTTPTLHCYFNWPVGKPITLDTKQVTSYIL